MAWDCGWDYFCYTACPSATLVRMLQSTIAFSRCIYNQQQQFIETLQWPHFLTYSLCFLDHFVHRSTNLPIHGEKQVFMFSNQRVYPFLHTLITRLAPLLIISYAEPLLMCIQFATSSVIENQATNLLSTVISSWCGWKPCSFLRSFLRPLYPFQPLVHLQTTKNWWRDVILLWY